MLNIDSFINNRQDAAAQSLAIQNDFFTLWSRRALKLQEAEIFLANYFARTMNTAIRVCDVMRALINPIMIIKQPLYARAVSKNLENLHDELGDGENKVSHIRLLAEWSNLLLTKLGSINVPIEDHYTKLVTEETNNFIEIQKRLYCQSTLEVVLSTALAQETFAHHMLQNLYDGYIANYKSLFSNDHDFIQSTKYFEVHIRGTEEKHAEYIEELLKIVCVDGSDLSTVIDSYNTFEQITHNFWNGIYKQIISHNTGNVL